MHSSILLAIETAGRCGSVALVECPAGADGADGADGGAKPGVLAAHDLPSDRRSAQTLAPAIDALLRDSGLSGKDVGAIAVAVGPGSFTGLRVGVTTAKTLAYATGARLVAVGTLDALTEPHRAADRRVWGVLDAQRGELFAAAYTGDTGGEVLRLPLDELAQRLETGDLVVGPPAESLAASSDAPIKRIAEPPTAAAVARLGAAKLAAGETVDPFQLVPEYHRVSAAEENFGTGR